MSFWTYILRCADVKYYTGHTDNLEYRFAQHQTGGFSEFTSERRPVTLFWSQEFTTRAEALDAEKQIKPWSRAKKEALARGDWGAVSFFAQPPNKRAIVCQLKSRSSRALVERLPPRVNDVSTSARHKRDGG